MTTPHDAARLARAWIEGWQAGTPDEIPLAPDFVHTSPFGVVQGRDLYLAQTKAMAAKNVVSLEIVKTLGDEHEAAIWFIMMTPHGPVQCCDWVQTENGVIVAITSFYDATDLRYHETPS